MQPQIIPDDPRRPQGPKEFQMPLDGTRWPGIAPDGSRLRKMVPDASRMLGMQYVLLKVIVLFFDQWEVSDSQNVVSAPDCYRWPGYFQMALDDSRFPQMTTWSYYPGKAFYQRGRLF